MSDDPRMPGGDRLQGGVFDSKRALLTELYKAVHEPRRLSGIIVRLTNSDCRKWEDGRWPHGEWPAYAELEAETAHLRRQLAELQA